MIYLTGSVDALPEHCSREPASRSPNLCPDQDRPGLALPRTTLHQVRSLAAYL